MEDSRVHCRQHLLAMTMSAIPLCFRNLQTCAGHSDWLGEFVSFKNGSLTHLAQPPYAGCVMVLLKDLDKADLLPRSP